jgi:hypothetical protein
VTAQYIKGIRQCTYTNYTEQEKATKLWILSRNNHSGPGKGNKLPATIKFTLKIAKKKRQRPCYLEHVFKIFGFLLEHDFKCGEFINDPCSHCPSNNCSPVLEAHAPEIRNEVKLMLPQYSPDDSLGKSFLFLENEIHRLFLTGLLVVAPNPD